MDISEKRVPQDGRMKLKFGNRRSTSRVSTLPTLFGEKVVIRILDPSSAKLGIEALGYERSRKGPPAGGHRAALRHDPGHRAHRLGQDGVAVHLPEHPEPAGREHFPRRDPAEINLPGINQVNVNDKAGLDLSAALKVLPAPGPGHHHGRRNPRPGNGRHRHQGGQTGHLVMSTLHTNDAPTTLTRC